MTEFKEAATELKITSAPSTIERSIAKPFDTETPIQLLTRMYQISSFNWEATSTYWQFNFPAALLAIPNIANVLQRFRYIRAGVRILIRMNSTQFMQGSLIGGWLPCWNAAAPPPDAFKLSGMSSFVLGASTQQSVTIDIPYLNPKDWLTIPYTTDTDSRIAVLWLRVLNQLQATGSACSAVVPMTVFAQFTNVTVEGFVSQSSKTMTHSDESETMNYKGIDVKAAVKAVSPIIRSAPVIGPMLDAATILLDLAKPVNQEASKPMYATIGQNLALTTGLDYSEQFTMYPNANVAQSQLFGGMETSHMAVSKLAQIPMLHYQFSFTDTNTQFYFPVTPFYRNGSNTPDYFYSVAKAFRYWRGSIKYSFYFVMPQFYSCRARILLHNLQADPVELGDVISKIVDLKGETWVDIMVPYLRPTTWVETKQDAVAAYYPRIYVQLECAINGCSTETPLIFCNVFRAAGEDTSFAQLMNPAEHLDSFQVKSQTSLRTHFSKAFDGIAGKTTQSVERGFCMPETAGTVSDCMRRHGRHVPDTQYGLTYPTAVSDANPAYPFVSQEPFNYFASHFLFWRGSRTTRRITVGTMITLRKFFDSTLSDQYNEIGDGAVLWQSPEGDALRYLDSAVIPYYTNVPWTPTFDPGKQFHSTLYPTTIQTDFPADLVPESQAAGGTRTLAAGDDFMALHPVPFFPLYDYTPPPAPRTTKVVPIKNNTKT